MTCSLPIGTTLLHRGRADRFCGVTPEGARPTGVLLEDPRAGDRIEAPAGEPTAAVRSGRRARGCPRETWTKSLRRLACQVSGYSMVEFLIVTLILGLVLGALTTMFVKGSAAELDANRRVQAQVQAAEAFDRLRRDVHCASSAAVVSATLTLSGCGSGSVSWCAVGSGSRYALYRLAGVSCDATGKLYADYLLSPSVFTYTAPVASTSLAKVHADVSVSVNPAKPTDTFELADDIVLRNSTRA